MSLSNHAGLKAPRFATLKGSRYSFTRRNRSAFPMTESELSVIAALAQMGLISTPAKGYSTPAAMGTPTVL